MRAAFVNLGLRSAKVAGRCKRSFSTQDPNLKNKNSRTGLHAFAACIGFLGASYAAVPLYRLFCQKTGFAGTVKTVDVDYERAKPLDNARMLTVVFSSNVAEGMVFLQLLFALKDGMTRDLQPWKFQPQQTEIKVLPGEASLAFYTAENKSSEPIVGVSTYNVQPDAAAVIFSFFLSPFHFPPRPISTKSSVFASRSSDLTPMRQWTCLSFFSSIQIF